MQPQLTEWNDEATEFTLVLSDNPLADFTELPEQYRGLFFSNVIAGVVRGALETVCVWARARDGERWSVFNRS